MEYKLLVNFNRELKEMLETLCRENHMVKAQLIRLLIVKAYKEQQDN